MDTTTLIILGIIVLLGIYLYNRNRVKPRGTYDDKNFRSGGSIGGNPAHDDKNFRSGGSIGGSSKTAHDSPDFKSGGSIAGQKRTVSNPSSATTERGPEKPRHDSRDFKSGGSIGGSSSSDDS
jgi:hypothetical protein